MLDMMLLTSCKVTSFDKPLISAYMITQTNHFTIMLFGKNIVGLALTKVPKQSITQLRQLNLQYPKCKFHSYRG